MEWLAILERGIWFGLAALGFAILFNVPVRTLFNIYLIAAIGGLAKTFFIYFGANVVMSTFLGATIIGFLSIPAAHNKHAPPLVFAIPAVIPLVPGVMAYRMMLGLIDLSGDVPSADNLILAETINNGLKVMFILMSIAGGVALPMLLTRKESAKQLRFKRSAA